MFLPSNQLLSKEAVYDNFAVSALLWLLVWKRHHTFIQYPIWEINLATPQWCSKTHQNPYLFKAKNIELAQDLVKGIVDAFLSSQEETLFGNLLEGFAVYVSSILYGGFKSEFKSIDLVDFVSKKE